MATILLVDDEDDIVEILGINLELHGYTCVSTTEANKVMQILEDNKIDLIITDFCMPQKNGYELIKEIRQKNKTIPIFLFFGGSDMSPSLPYNQGVCSLLKKPFNTDLLVEDIKHYLTPLPQRWTGNNKNISPVTPIKVQFSSFAEAIKHDLKVGRGGFVLNLNTAILTNIMLSSLKNVEFSLGFLEENITVQGKGMVRWSESIDAHKTKIGIEIMYLDANSADFICSKTQLDNEIAFIPKDII